MQKMNSLILKIKEELSKKDRVIIGIDGMCASGKSTLAKELKNIFNATVFHMDDFFLPPEKKTLERMNEPGGNVDYERILKEIHSKLKMNSINYERYCCKDGNLYENKVKLSNLIIIEGVYSMRYEFREFYDLTIFMEIDTETQKSRLKNRNSKLYSKFIDEWIPMENKYFNEIKVKEAVDVVLGENYGTKVYNCKRC